MTKLAKYQKAGVIEYWMVNPEQEKTILMNFKNPENTGEYTFDDTITSQVLEGLEINIRAMLKNY